MKKRLMLIMLLVLSSISLAGCQLGGSEVLQIESVTTQEVEDGTMVTITYVDDLEPPYSFLIPKGKDGKGISDVFQEVNLEENTTEITFYFEEDYLQPYVVSVPNGVGITDLIESHDEEGNTHIKLRYTNNEESEEFVISKGDTGNNGLSVVRIDNEYNDTFDQVIFTFYYSDDLEVDPYSDEFEPIKTEQVTVDILQGVGVESVVAGYDEETMEYNITILLTNGSVIPLSFQRMNTIFTGIYQPLPNQGIDGDYYFETGEKNMWTKSNGRWSIVYSLSADSIHRVTLNLNAGGDSSASLNLLQDHNYYDISDGKYLAFYGYELPEPTRDGYEFIGWYLTATPRINSGKFTDLIPVYSDLQIYAGWKEVTAE